MKLEDVILVTENCKGTKAKFLLNISDYIEMVLQDCEYSAMEVSDVLEQLYGTKEGKGGCSELYYQGDLSRQTRFCSSQAQLQSFLLGMQEEENEKKPVFDNSRCSQECLEVLKAYGIDTKGHSLFHTLHYEEKAYVFKRGEILHNLNGCDYRVLSVLSEKNLFLMSQSDGQYIVAIGASMYERSPKEGNKAKDSIIKGVEWGHGIYLGHDIMKIDLDSIIQEYGRPRQINSIEDYYDEIRQQFVKLKSLSQNTRLAQVVRWAAEKEMMETFETTDRDVFRKNLDKGGYDDGFHKLVEEKKEKMR